MGGEGTETGMERGGDTPCHSRVGFHCYRNERECNHRPEGVSEDGEGRNAGKGWEGREWGEDLKGRREAGSGRV